MTPNQQWFVFRRYSEFHALHQKLVKQCGLKKDLLPSKRLTGERGTTDISTLRPPFRPDLAAAAFSASCCLPPHLPNRQHLRQPDADEAQRA
jgi:hypothetical protein